MSDPTLTTLVGAFICWAFFFFVLQDEPIGFLLSKKIKEEVPEYEFYETAQAIIEVWHDEPGPIPCDVCGLSDTPVLEVFGGKADFKCKWCAELDNLNYHLKHHGTRRLKKVS